MDPGFQDLLDSAQSRTGGGVACGAGTFVGNLHLIGLVHPKDVDSACIEFDVGADFLIDDLFEKFHFLMLGELLPPE